MARGQIAERIDALIWPTVTYGYYPAFVEYAGSSSLSASTFEAVVHEIAADILDNGMPQLFVLDTGISTLAPVDRALARLDDRQGDASADSRGPALSRVPRHSWPSRAMAAMPTNSRRR